MRFVTCVRGGEGSCGRRGEEGGCVRSWSVPLVSRL